MVVTLNLYRYTCPSGQVFEEWLEEAPSQCINGDPILSGTLSIIDTVSEQEVEAHIVEEQVKTGGRFQTRNVVIDLTQSGTLIKDVEWPIPISLLSAEFVIEAEHKGDAIECAASPNTVIGTLSSEASVSGTSLSIATPVFNKIEDGFFIGYTTNMVDFHELGIVTELDSDTQSVTISNELLGTLPAGTPIYIEAKFVTDFQLWNKTRHTIGDTKVGASYLEAGKKLQFRYFNHSGTTNKKFTIMLEYLY